MKNIALSLLSTKIRKTKAVSGETLEGMNWWSFSSKWKGAIEKADKVKSVQHDKNHHLLSGICVFKKQIQERLFLCDTRNYDEKVSTIDFLWIAVWAILRPDILLKTITVHKMQITT